ncbi:PREDICTED: uncharacterized protein LOC109348071 [Lupinus angustifolius]|uniref:uncharacterized protein LOC109348071 n=1 Tax=Lupinus angustifolius TaxID=3871 RepID=UPI00092E5385|nr:PREDICTED: uncharacterized protein LOC109348071 [Lupinus angustifolius]
MATNTTNTGISPPISPSAASLLQAASSPLLLPLPSMKLTEKNYLVWRHFMLATLTSNRANRYVLGTEIPHRFLNDDDRLINRVNPAYLRWEEVDQTVFSWILNSLSESLQPRVVGCVHSWQLWEELDAFCNSQTKARSRQLRSQLRSISQGSCSISDYFTKIKGLVDALIFIGTPISSSEHIDYILDGLNEEYQPVITSIESQMDLPTVHNLESFLLTFESRLEKNKTKAISDALSVNVASDSPISSTPVSSHFRSSMPHQSTYSPKSESQHNTGGYGNFSNFRGGRGRRGGYGGRGGYRGGRSHRGGASLFCVYCNRHGHDVVTCYYAPPNFGGTLSYATPAGQHVPHMTSGYETRHPAFHSFQNTHGQSRYPAHFYPEYPLDFYSGNGGHYGTSYTRNSLLGPGPAYNQHSNYHHYPMSAHVANREQASPPPSRDSKPVTWYPDSGATNHLTADASLVHEPIETFGHEQIYMGNGSGISIKSVGNSHFTSSLNSTVSLSLNNLLYVPSITKNLLSVSQFTKDNSCYFEFHPNTCFVKSQATNELLLQGFLTKEGLYAFHGLLPNFTSCQPSTFTHTKDCTGLPVSNPCNKTSLHSLWHYRLGHPHFTVVKDVLKLCKIPCANNNDFEFCNSCCVGKAHRIHAPRSTSVYNACFELVYVDLWGPAPVHSITGFRYYLSIVDAYTKHTWIFLLKQKSETLSVFQYFLKFVHTQFNTTIKSVQSDYGGEFRPFSAFLKTIGVVHRISCPHTHHQQGTVERKHRHIVETGLTLLTHAQLPMNYWDHAFITAVFLINRLPTITLQHNSPYQLLFGHSPDYNFLKVFGCACFPLLRPYNKHKLDPRSSECTFLGYSLNHKGYKCLSKDGKIYISKDVIFNESKFPFANSSHSSDSKPLHTNVSNPSVICHNSPLYSTVPTTSPIHHSTPHCLPCQTLSEFIEISYLLV